MTWSPFLRLATPGPTSTTMPAPSWPRMAGKSPSGSAPDSVYLSVWHIPVAFSSTRTSPARGPASCTVSMVSGAPALWAMAARTSMGPSWEKRSGAISHSSASRTISVIDRFSLQREVAHVLQDPGDDRRMPGACRLRPPVVIGARRFGFRPLRRVHAKGDAQREDRDHGDEGGGRSDPRSRHDTRDGRGQRARREAGA